MRAIITVDDGLLQELLVLTGTEDLAAAVNAAIEGHVRRLKLERLRRLTGDVDIAPNDKVEAADLTETVGPGPWPPSG